MCLVSYAIICYMVIYKTHSYLRSSLWRSTRWTYTYWCGCALSHSIAAQHREREWYKNIISIICVCVRRAMSVCVCVCLTHGGKSKKRKSCHRFAATARRPPQKKIHTHGTTAHDLISWTCPCSVGGSISFRFCPLWWFFHTSSRRARLIRSLDPVHVCVCTGLKPRFF